MGCWSATCGLSGLPITDGEPVIAMIIRREMGTATPCNPWDCYAPASLLIRGPYDDYGSLTVNEPLLEILRVTQDNSSVVQRFADDDNRSLVMKRIEPFIAEFSNAERKDFSLRRQKGDNFALWLAHATFFDTLRKRVTDMWGTPIDESIAAEEAKLREAYAAIDWDDPMAAFMLATNKWVQYDFKGAAAEYLQQHLKPNDPNYEALIAEWRELKAVQMIMDTLRITLYPNGSCGAQDLSYEDHRILNDLRNQHINEQLERFK